MPGIAHHEGIEVREVGDETLSQHAIEKQTQDCNRIKLQFKIRKVRSKSTIKRIKYQLKEIKRNL